MIRVIYEFEVVPGKEAQLEQAWREIVEAHAGEGALESILARDPEPAEEGANRFVAISRWRSRQHWEEGRRDDAAPDAYERFHDAVEVLSPRVLQERATLRAKE